MEPVLLTTVEYKRQRGRWPFVLTEPLLVKLGLGFEGRHSFMDRDKHRGSLRDDVLTIEPGYASDGCSPYYGSFLGIRIGTPSPRSSAAGFFVHDFLYQFKRLPCAPWTYQQANDIFWSLLRKNGFPLAELYFGAVSLFGGLHRTIHSDSENNTTCLDHA